MKSGNQSEWENPHTSKIVTETQEVEKEEVVATVKD